MVLQKYGGNTVKAVLFDSGRVLNAPESGNWFITPRFYDFVMRDAFLNIPLRKRRKAFSDANRYISAKPLIETVEEEYACFLEFYRIFATALPELGLSESDIEGLTRDLVYNPQKYRFFDDVAGTLAALHGRYQLAVVSNAWPSLEAVFENAGLRNYFSSFVISSKLGVEKPDKHMYFTALRELNVQPAEAVFVDDSLANCLSAQKLGIHAVLLRRNRAAAFLSRVRSIGKGYNVIQNLRKL